MPILMCPNCETGMKQINRESVQIDMCPQCQGVWLDRGELQKLIAVTQQPDMPMQSPPPRPAQQQPYRDDDYHHHGKYRKKSKLESIFDMFD